MNHYHIRLSSLNLIFYKPKLSSNDLSKIILDHRTSNMGNR
jgi:hypothetical protein